MKLEGGQHGSVLAEACLNFISTSIGDEEEQAAAPTRATRLASHCADCRARRKSLFIRSVTKPPPSNGKYRSGPRRSRSARVPAPTSACSQPVLVACLLSHPRIRVEVAQHDARQPVRMCTESRHAPERQEGAKLAESSTGTKGHIRAGMREHYGTT